MNVRPAFFCNSRCLHVQAIRFRSTILNGSGFWKSLTDWVTLALELTTFFGSTDWKSHTTTLSLTLPRNNHRRYLSGSRFLWIRRGSCTCIRCFDPYMRLRSCMDCWNILDRQYTNISILIWTWTFAREKRRLGSCRREVVVIRVYRNKLTKIYLCRLNAAL